MSFSINEAAKLLNTGQNKLFLLLREDKILNNSNLPYQTYIDQGFFKVSERTFPHPICGPRHYGKTFVTDKGIEWLKHRYQGKFNQPIKILPWHNYKFRVKATGEELQGIHTCTLFFDQHYNAYTHDDVEVLEYLDEWIPEELPCTPSLPVMEEAC